MREIFLSIFLIILVTLFVFFLGPRILVVEKVTCESQNGSCSPRVLEEASKVRGEKLILARGLISKTFKNHPFVENFFMTFKFPNRLDLFVVERKGKFALASAKGNAIFLVSEDGLILSDDKNDTKYPLLISNDPLPLLGEKVDYKTLFALDISLKISEILGVERSVKEGNVLIIELKNGPKVLFPLEGDKDFLLGSFVLIYNELKKETQDSKINFNSVSEIDLRYKNPVLRLKNFS